VLSNCQLPPIQNITSRERVNNDKVIQLPKIPDGTNTEKQKIT